MILEGARESSRLIVQRYCLCSRLPFLSSQVGDGVNKRRNIMLSDQLQRGLERINKTLVGMPDRIPVTAQCGAHTMNLVKADPAKFLHNPEQFVKAHILVADYYKFDMPSFTYDCYNIEAEAMGQPLVWVEGQLPEVDVFGYLLKQPSDLDKLVPPDPYKDGRMPHILELHKRTVDLGYSHAARFCAPFTLAANLRGLSNLIMDIMTQPEFVHKLMTFLTDDVLAPYLRALHKVRGKELAIIGVDAMASLPIINMDIVNDFAMHYIRRLRNHGNKIVVRAWWGERFLKTPEEILELKLEAGNLMILDPDLHEVGPQVFKEFAMKNDALLYFCLDASLIKKGDTDELIRRVKDYTTVGGKGGKCIFVLADVPNETSPQRVHMTVQAAQFFGAKDYIDGKLDEQFQFTPRESFEQWLQKLD